MRQAGKLHRLDDFLAPPPKIPNLDSNVQRFLRSTTAFAQLTCNQHTSWTPSIANSIILSHTQREALALCRQPYKNLHFCRAVVTLSPQPLLAPYSNFPVPRIIFSPLLNSTNNTNETQLDIMPFPFLKLPREIQIIIMEFALAVDDVTNHVEASSDLVSCLTVSSYMYWLSLPIAHRHVRCQSFSSHTGCFAPRTTCTFKIIGPI